MSRFYSKNGSINRIYVVSIFCIVTTFIISSAFAYAKSYNHATPAYLRDPIIALILTLIGMSIYYTIRFVSDKNTESKYQDKANIQNHAEEEQRISQVSDSILSEVRSQMLSAFENYKTNGNIDNAFLKEHFHADLLYPPDVLLSYWKMPKEEAKRNHFGVGGLEYVSEACQCARVLIRLNGAVYANLGVRFPAVMRDYFESLAQMEEVDAKREFIRLKPKFHTIASPKIRKPARNDPCPCGSGKKYKYCCGK